MFIQIQDTPNPSTLKFILGIEILPTGQSMSFKESNDCKASNLAEQLLNINGIESIFFSNDFISITKSTVLEWHELKTIIVATIVDYITAGLPILQIENVRVNNNVSTASVSDQDIVKQIIEVINEKIRPNVAQDGGDVQFHSYENGVVYLTMHGACAGCPSATVTLKDGIENMLQYYIPEVIRVEQI